jgi:hypothetical protein
LLHIVDGMAPIDSVSKAIDEVVTNGRTGQGEAKAS